MRDLVDRLRPRSIQARVALAIGVALVVVFVVVQLVFVSFVEARSRDEVERALHDQAESIARQIERNGLENAPSTAREAQRYIGDARLVVYVEGTSVHWNRPVEDLEASARVTRGDLEVLLERPDPSAGLMSDWMFVALLAIGIVGTGALIWGLALGIGSRLRASVSTLADSAEAVTAGRFDVRAPVTDDELGRLAQEFNRMTARLESADLRQREFLADVAHELRTPVTAIEGFAQALEDGTASTEEDRRESAEFIRAEAARLRDLVRDLQQITWLDLDPPVTTAPMDLMDAGRDVVARLGIEARDKGVSLHPPEGSLIALGDPAHVETILSNLVSNAIRATPRGGFVHLSPATAPGQAGISVSDTGVGIPAEHLPYIFDRLYRVQSGRQRPAGGSGLGLSIVRRLATLLGGRVTVRSTPGEGSVFTLWLPAKAVAPARRARVGSGQE
ncbi:MAG: sensor histidine kinase [Thermoleophilia bacterium]